MKVSDINKLIKKHIEAQLTDYNIHRDLIFKIEHNFFIKGYDFESSGNGEYDLSVWCFIQPTFVKSNCLYYTFGGRLKYKKKIDWIRTRKLEWWDATKENVDESFQSILQSILSDGEKYLNSFKTAEDFYKKFKSSAKYNIRIYEAVAYTSILMGDKALQDKMLQGLIDFSLAEINRGTDWIDQIREDATLLLNAETLEKRLEILKSWANETISHLKLPNLTPFI